MTSKTLLDYDLELNDGKTMPALGLGTVLPDEPELIVDAVKVAIRSGVRHIDTAWYYGSEPYIGKALKELFDAGELKREDIFITTKVWPCLWNKVEFSVKKSLSDLGIEYADLVLQHWPVTYRGVDENGYPKNPYDEDGKLKFGEEGEYLETFKQLIKLRNDTKLAKSIGVSNYTPKHLDYIIAETGVIPTVNQIELHPRIPQKDLVKYFEDKGVKLIAYSPLGSSGAPLLKEPIVKDLAIKYNVGIGSILLSYHVLSGRGVICRSVNPKRIENFGEVAPLTAEDIASLEALGINEPKRFVNCDWGVNLGFENWGTE